MKYPAWAPPTLVEQLKKQLAYNLLGRGVNAHEPDAIVADAAQKHEGMTQESLEDFRRYLCRTSLGLPCRESTELLDRLIIDQRMKNVWKALTRRVGKDIELLQFFYACESGITGWRGDIKQTAAERKAFYQEIRDTALKLASLMSKADQFDRYSIDEIVVDRIFQLSYTRPVSVYETRPRINEVLVDISKKAAQYGEIESSVKKPNSENADIHYFVRGLSEYLKNKYGQPLHEVVAVTTEVVFDRGSIDSDYVRKLVG